MRFLTWGETFTRQTVREGPPMESARGEKAAALVRCRQHLHGINTQPTNARHPHFAMISHALRKHQHTAAKCTNVTDESSSANQDLSIHPHDDEEGGPRDGRRKRSGRQIEDGPLGASLEAAGRLQNFPRLERSPWAYFVRTLLVMIQMVNITDGSPQHISSPNCLLCLRPPKTRDVSWASQKKTRVSSTMKAEPHLPRQAHKSSRIFSRRSSDVFYDALGISFMMLRHLFYGALGISHMRSHDA